MREMKSYKMRYRGILWVLEWGEAEKGVIVGELRVARRRMRTYRSFED